jgi:hypothetical protein
VVNENNIRDKLDTDMQINMKDALLDGCRLIADRIIIPKNTPTVKLAIAIPYLAAPKLGVNWKSGIKSITAICNKKLKIENIKSMYNNPCCFQTNERDSLRSEMKIL